MAFESNIQIFLTLVNNILIEHNGGSVAVYKGFGEGQMEAKEGDEVLPHSFIGLVGSTPTNKKYLSFMLYYLSATGFEEGSKAEQTFVTPVFLTTTGSSQLTNRQKYESAISNEIITKEMSRRQKKDFEKTKAIK